MHRPRCGKQKTQALKSPLHPLQVLTTTSPEEQATGLRTLLKMQCGDGLMHESVHVNDLKSCTRKWFEAREGRREGSGGASLGRVLPCRMRCPATLALVSASRLLPLCSGPTRCWPSLWSSCLDMTATSKLKGPTVQLCRQAWRQGCCLQEVYMLACPGTESWATADLWLHPRNPAGARAGGRRGGQPAVLPPFGGQPPARWHLCLQGGGLERNWKLDPRQPLTGVAGYLCELHAELWWRATHAQQFGRNAGQTARWRSRAGAVHASWHCKCCGVPLLFPATMIPGARTESTDGSTR